MKLEELKQSFSALDEKLKQAKAECDDDKYASIFQYLWDMNMTTREYLYELEEAMARHASPQNGHLPKIKGAGKMEKALKVLGMDDDYAIQKPSIMVRANRSGKKEFTVELKAPKNEEV